MYNQFCVVGHLGRTACISSSVPCRHNSNEWVLEKCRDDKRREKSRKRQSEIKSLHETGIGKPAFVKMHQNSIFQIINILWTGNRIFDINLAAAVFP